MIKDRKKEIGPGLLRKMLTDLGLAQSVPDPSSVAAGQVLIFGPPNMAVKTALYAAVKEQDVGSIELAE